MILILLLLIFTLIFTLILSKIFIYFFQDKNKILNKKMFKIVGDSAIAITDISEIFGIVEFKDDFGNEKKVVCYSHKDKIKKGYRVLITDYNLYKDMYIVDEYPR